MVETDNIISGIMSLCLCIMFVILITGTLRSVITFLQQKTNFSIFTINTSTRCKVGVRYLYSCKELYQNWCLTTFYVVL